MVVLCLGATPSLAKIYKWKDDAGKLHFTDDPSQIPLKYRQEQKIETLRTKPEITNPVKLKIPDHTPKKHVIPLTPVGNGNYLVDVMINGRIPAKFVVDTGASSVTLSEKLGRKVHRNLSSLPKLPVQTGGGIVESPLLVLKSIKVGTAKVKDVEANINEFMGEGFDGLLGMSFLADFQVQVDNSDDALILNPLGKGDEPTWDGKTEKWWTRKYKDYVSKMLGYRMMADQNKNDYQAVKNFKKLSEFYKDLYRSLDRRAERAGLPEEHRIDPEKTRVQFR
jgi:clan AA aspartic protease (TIGR02281 family)